MAKRTLILFDVDGTLTEPRQLIQQPMINAIMRLHDITDIDIGTVGGSDLVKQSEQLGKSCLELFDYVFSENGLVGYHNNILINKTSIVDYIGETNIQKMINTILGYLSTIELPVKRGTFIEFRNGMINVSPIGRSCSTKYD
jgi:phosphomannomutase